LSASESRLVIEKLAAANIFEVNLGGGESLLRPDIFEILAALSEHGIMADLSTNGWIVDKACAKELKRVGVSKVYVSLDHVEVVDHDYTRNREGSFDRVLQAINHLRNEGIPVGISTVISQKNKDVLVPLIELARKLGLIEVNFKKFRSLGNGFVNAGEFELNEAESDRTTQNLSALKRQYHDKIKITYVYSDFPVPGLTEGCPCGRTSLAIHPNGNLLMCVYGKTILGHILRDDIQHVWKTHPFLIKNRCSHICEAAMIKNVGYVANAKILKQRDIRIPTGMSTGEAVSQGLFKPDAIDATVSVVSLAGKTYNLNLAGTVVFESLSSGEHIEDIERRFREIFSSGNDRNMREDIGVIQEKMVDLRILEETPQAR
jgi:MoaA/NifB/PqqE/SkfB family radical SAM enzyme